MLDTILTRLKAVHDEIAGVTAYKLPPSGWSAARQVSLPVLYAIPTGATETHITRGDTERQYTFAVEVLVRLATFAQLDANAIAAGVSETATWVETISDHYTAHRYLHTASLTNLNYMSAPLRVQWGEIDIRPATIDTKSLYFGIIFNLTVPVHVQESPYFS